MPDDYSVNKPSHIVYRVSEGRDGNARFSRCGVAFEHRDEQCFSVSLDAIPVSEQAASRVPQDRKRSRFLPIREWLSVICQGLSTVLTQRSLQ